MAKQPKPTTTTSEPTSDAVDHAAAHAAIDIDNMVAIMEAHDSAATEPTTEPTSEPTIDQGEPTSEPTTADGDSEPTTVTIDHAAILATFWADAVSDQGAHTPTTADPHGRSTIDPTTGTVPAALGAAAADILRTIPKRDRLALVVAQSNDTASAAMGAGDIPTVVRNAGLTKAATAAVDAVAGQRATVAVDPAERERERVAAERHAASLALVRRLQALDTAERHAIWTYGDILGDQDAAWSFAFPTDGSDAAAERSAVDALVAADDTSVSDAKLVSDAVDRVAKRRGTSAPRDPNAPRKPRGASKPRAAAGAHQVGTRWTHGEKGTDVATVRAADAIDVHRGDGTLVGTAATLTAACKLVNGGTSDSGPRYWSHQLPAVTSDAAADDTIV